PVSVATMTIMATNNRVRNRATPLSLECLVGLMGNQRGTFRSSSTRQVSLAWFCCRSTLSVCSDLQEVRLIESAHLCRSSQNTEYSRRGSIRACVRECRTEV